MWGTHPEKPLTVVSAPRRDTSLNWHAATSTLTVLAIGQLNSKTEGFRHVITRNKHSSSLHMKCTAGILFAKITRILIQTQPAATHCYASHILSHSTYECRPRSCIGTRQWTHNAILQNTLTHFSNRAWHTERCYSLHCIATLYATLRITDTAQHALRSVTKRTPQRAITMHISPLMYLATIRRTH